MGDFEHTEVKKIVLHLLDEIIPVIELIEKFLERRKETSLKNNLGGVVLFEGKEMFHLTSLIFYLSKLINFIARLTEEFERESHEEKDINSLIKLADESLQILYLSYAGYFPKAYKMLVPARDTDLGLTITIANVIYDFSKKRDKILSEIAKRMETVTLLAENIAFYMNRDIALYLIRDKIKNIETEEEMEDFEPTENPDIEEF